MDGGWQVEDAGSVQNQGGSQRGDRGWGRGGPASGQRAHGDGKTVATQTATQVPLTLSRPFLLSDLVLRTHDRTQTPADKSLGLGGGGHSGQTKASLFLIFAFLTTKQFCVAGQACSGQLSFKIRVNFPFQQPSL